MAGGSNFGRLLGLNKSVDNSGGIKGWFKVPFGKPRMGLDLSKVTKVRLEDPRDFRGGRMDPLSGRTPRSL
jgi:hypothetical protein